MAAFEARFLVVQKVVLCKKQRELVNTTHSSVFAMNGNSFLKVLDLESFFLAVGLPEPCLNAVGNVTSVKRGVYNVSKRRYD